MEYMRTLPDKYFSLCIADPPYGIGADRGQKARAGTQYGKSKATCKDYGDSDWDMKAPDMEWFNEIRRVSENQIIWGANHFISNIPVDSPCWIVWDKDNGTNDYADCELAWTSFPTPVRKFRYKWHGMLQEDMKHKEERIHPTQKPVALYAWLISNYAKQGGVIFDPMTGSGSSRIAAYKLGYDFIGCEIDKEYFDKSVERFNAECKGIVTAKDGSTYVQKSLFDM